MARYGSTSRTRGSRSRSSSLRTCSARASQVFAGALSSGGVVRGAAPRRCGAHAQRARSAERAGALVRSEGLAVGEGRRRRELAVTDREVPHRQGEAAISERAGLRRGSVTCSARIARGRLRRARRLRLELVEARPYDGRPWDPLCVVDFRSSKRATDGKLTYSHIAVRRAAEGRSESSTAIRRA